MKRLFLLIPFCFLCLLLTYNSLMAYQWPLRGSTGNYSGPFPIRGTFGEYRSGNSIHLHDGVDIDATNGTAIYPINGGTLTLTPEQIKTLKRGATDEYLRIGTYAYVHISINNAIWNDLNEGLSVTFTAFNTVIAKNSGDILLNTGDRLENGISIFGLGRSCSNIAYTIAITIT